MDEKELERLYNAVNSKFDVGDYNTFKSKMGTSDDRKKFYDAVGSKGFDLGDYNQFETRIGGKQEPIPHDAKAFNPIASEPQPLPEVHGEVPQPAQSTFTAPDIFGRRKSRVDPDLTSRDIDKNIAAFERKDAAKGAGNVGSYLANKPLEGGGSMTAGVVDMAMNLLTSVIPESMQGGTKEQSMKMIREQVEPTVRTALKDKFGADVSDTREKEYNDQFVTSTVAGALHMLPAMGLPKGLGFTAQGYDGAMQTINSTEKGKDLPEATKSVFAMGEGIVQGVLMDYGLGKIFGKEAPDVARKISTDAFNRLIDSGKKDITKEMFEAAVQGELKTLKEKVVSAGGKIVKSGIIQGAVGGGIEGTNILAEKLLNKSTGQDVFEPQSWGENLGRVMQAAKGGAAMGVLLGGVHLPFHEVENYVANEVEKAKTPQDIKALKDGLAKNIQDGQMTPEHAEKVNKLVDQYANIYSRIPEDAANRPVVAQKIKERELLKNDIEKKEAELKKTDEAFHAPLEEEIKTADGRVEEINDEIKKIAEVPEVKEEAPVVKDDKPITVYRSGAVNNDVVYTAETKDYADQFAGEKGKKGEADVKEMQIQPKNVLDLTDSYNNKTSPLAVQKVLESKGVEFTEPEKQRIAALDENYSGDPTFSHIVNVPSFIDAAKRAGFDAIKQKETTVADEYGTMSDKEKDLHTSYAVIDPSIILDKDSRVAAQAEAVRKNYLADKEKEVGYQTFSNDNAKYQKEAEQAKQDFIGKEAEPSKGNEGLMTDDKGEPLTFYHGTRKTNITELEPSTAPQLGKGIYFGSTKEGVIDFLDVGEKGQIFEVHIPNNLLRADGGEYGSIKSQVEDETGIDRDSHRFPLEKVNDEVKKRGYKGLIQDNDEYGGQEVMIFDKKDVVYKNKSENKPIPKEAPAPKLEPKPLTKQERSNNLIDAVRKFNDTAKNKRSERATMSNQIKMEAQELGLKLADNGGRLTLQSKAGKKLQKRGTETNKSVSSTFDEANYSPETKEIVKIATGNPNIVSDLYIEGNDGIKMSRKQVESALNDFKEGKATVGSEAIHDRIQEMVDSGEVKHLDHTGLKEDTENPPMKIKDWVELFKEPEPTELNEKERAIANEKINTDIAEQIINDEGLTKETLEENKHLFEGFPYTEEDYNNVKNYLDETGRRTEEPGENEQPGVSNAEDKAAGVPGKEGEENSGTTPEEHQQGETTGQGLKELQSAHDKAVRELETATEKLAKEQATQTDIFGNATAQKGMFEQNDQKEILDPLKAKVKETKAALDKATKEAEVAKDNENPDLFPTEKEQKGIIEKMGSPIGEWLKRAFTSNRGLPEMWMVLKDLATGRRQLAARNMRKAIYNLQDAVKQTKYTDTDKISEALKDTNGTAFQSLPPEIQTAVKDMRLMVDGFSEGLVTEGLVTPGQALTISDHIGEYLNRSYKLHTQKDWIKKVDPAVKADAIKFLTQQRLSEINADPNHVTKTAAERMDLAQKLGEQDANDILTKKDTPTGQRYTEQFSKDLSTLKTRQDIPEPIRKLMGEYTDPVTQFAITISKLATLHSQAKLLNSLRDTFKGQLFFEKDEVRPEGFNYLVASDGSQAWNPLAGLYTSKNAIEALQENAQHMEAWHRIYQKAFGTVKKFKTVYSVPTQVVNFFANPFISLANGHFNLSKLDKSWDYYKDTMFNKERGSDDVINTLVERNVIGQSVNLRQIRDMLGKDKADEFALSEFMKPKKSNWNPLKWIDKADKVMQNQYSASDSFWKVYGFMNEATGLSDALFGKKYKDLTGVDKIKIDELASERIKNTYPTYDRALPALMAAGKNIPFVGNFMAFQAEVLRTVKNNILYAKQDLQDPNPKIKQMGAKRLAGLISYVGLKQGINLAVVMATGTAASSLWAVATGNDDEKSKRQSLDKFAPDFLQTHNLMVESKANGIYSVYDIDRLDPYNAAWQSLNGFAVGKDGGVAKAIEELAGPFVEPDMLLRAAMDINKNENFSGKPIYNTADTKERQFMDKMAYVYGVIEPTTAKLFNRARKADSPTKEVVASLFGARSYDIDVKLSFKSKVHEAEEKLSANSYFNYKDKEGTEKQELKDNFKRAVMELNDYYNSAVKLGASPAELNELLGKSFSRISGASRIKQIIKTGNVKDSDIDTIYKKKK